MVRLFLINTFKPSRFFLTQIILCLIGVICEDVTVFRLCALFILFFCLYRGSKERYIINPFYLIILTPFSLLIYVNIGNSFMLDLTVKTWMLIILNINALLFGYHITKETKCTERLLSEAEQKEIYSLMAWVFVVIGVVPSYYFKFTGNHFPIAYIITMLSTAGVISAFATKIKQLSIIILIIYISPIALGGTSKTYILTLLIAGIIAYEKYYTYDNKEKLLKTRKRLYIMCFLAVPAMIYSFSFANKDRGNYDAEEGLSYYASRVDWTLDAVYFLPYMYIVTPWTNLQYVTETQDTRTYGYWFTKPVLGIFDTEELENSKYEMEPYSSFNTFTFIAVHFKDLGYYGSILMSLFLGFFIKKVYSLFKKSSCPFDAAQYVYTGQATLELFFSNHFFGQSYPFMIVIVMYLTKKIFKI